MKKNNCTDFNVCVVIVNYHCQDLIVDCIDSLTRCIPYDLTFVVVDNSRIEDTDRLDKKYPNVVIFRSGSNLGFAGGCNIGIKYALSREIEYILLLNPDTKAEHDFLTPLVFALENNPDIGIVGPKIIRENNKREIWCAGGDLNWWIGGPKHIKDDRYRDKKEAVLVPFLSGCTMLLRGKAIQQVGLMDERYFLYFEDADYVQRFIQNGFGVAYVPISEILHMPSSSIGFQSKDYVYYLSRNRIWFMRRWARWYHYLVFMIYHTILKLPGKVFEFGLLQRQPRLIKEFFRGYVDGLRSIPGSRIIL